MTPYELTELTINATQRLDASWALFWSIHAAVFGGIVYIDRPLRRSEKIVSICAYLAIALYNYYLISNSQLLLSNLYHDIANIKNLQKLNLHTLDFFSDISHSAWGWTSHTFTAVIHALALVVVLAAIVTDTSLKNKK